MSFLIQVPRHASSLLDPDQGSGLGLCCSRQNILGKIGCYSCCEKAARYKHWLNYLPLEILGFLEWNWSMSDWIGTDVQALVEPNRSVARFAYRVS